MNRVSIPADAVAAGRYLPAVCVRHGEPAVTTRKVSLVSKPAPWTYWLLLLGVLPWAVAVSVTRKTIVAPAWPWCTDCLALRKRALVAVGLMAVSLLLAGVLIFTENEAAALVGLVFLFGGLGIGVYAARYNAVGISAAFVSRDGQRVEAKDAHERFAAQVHAVWVPTAPATVC